MIQYNSFTLENGLRVLVHEDPTTPLAVFNLFYNVGSRDDKPEKTGFAHLFEHLMFEGSLHIDSFDDAIHQAGGTSNAFTGPDFTNYFDVLPANNIETAFWLESDRMLSLEFNQEKLDIQKGVVCEEFKEHYINTPYGDVWHKLQSLSFNKHPYKNMVIGKELSHIQEAELQEVKDFFYTHYRPNNAILTIVGGVSTKKMKELAQKWFNDIPASQKTQKKYVKEPKQTEPRYLSVYADVPLDAIYLAFHAYSRLDENYYPADFLSGILSGGDSSRLYQKLVEQQQLFSNIDAYMTDDFDPGLFFIFGKLNKGINMQQAENAIWNELELLKSELINTPEIEKVNNKIEASIIFSESNNQDKAFRLAYYEALGNANEINLEAQRYAEIKPEQLNKVANLMFVKNNCSTLYYYANKQK